MTGITGRVQYDSATNQIVGHVLPLNSDSVPVSYSFPATSAKVIEEYFKNNKTAAHLHVFIVQPAVDSAPPFCLSVFGSDNKMTSEVCEQLLNVQIKNYNDL